MCKFHIWNRNLSLNSRQEQSIFSIKISEKLADMLISEFNDKLPLISELSDCDYELYSMEQFGELKDELNYLANLKPEFKSNIEEILSLIVRANEVNMDILFDPF